MRPFLRARRTNALRQLTIRKSNHDTIRDKRPSSRNARFGLGQHLRPHPGFVINILTGNPRIPWKFSTALEYWHGEALTVRERAMMAMMGSIVGKPDWQRKVFDEAICKKWRMEAVGDRDGTGEGPEYGSEFSARMFDFCIAELRHNATFFSEHGFVPVLDGTATAYAGDGIVSEDVRQALQRGASRLENIPDEGKDWHPGSDGKVLNLVQPSLCPLVYGRTRTLIGRDDVADLRNARRWDSDIIPEPDDTDVGSVEFLDIGQGKNAACYSQKFQWLPCDIHFEANDKVRLASYINNLHPDEHEDLYSTIEEIIAKVIPMWNETLNSTIRQLPQRITTKNITTAEFAKRTRPPVEDEDELDEDDKHDLEWEWAESIYAIVPLEPTDWATRERERKPPTAVGTIRDPSTCVKTSQTRVFR